MKVNIIGKGVIPYVNRVAPVYNTEVNAEILKKLVKNPKYKIYGSDGSGQVTAATFNPPIPSAPPVVEEKPVVKEIPKKTFKKAKKVEEAPKVEEVAGVVTDIVVEEKADVVEETLPEITEQEIVDGEIIEEPTPAEEVPEVEELEIPIEETDVEAFPAEEEESVEESTDAEAPKQPSKKNKKKNRK